MKFNLYQKILETKRTLQICSPPFLKHALLFAKRRERDSVGTSGVLSPNDALDR